MSRPRARLAASNRPIWDPPVTIGAHRLWTELWNSVGYAEENSGHPGGNRYAPAAGYATVHNSRARIRIPLTAAVHTGSRPDLAGRPVSPESTAPKTATTLFISERSPASRHDGASRDCPCRWPGSCSSQNRRHLP